MFVLRYLYVFIGCVSLYVTSASVSYGRPDIVVKTVSDAVKDAWGMKDTSGDKGGSRGDFIQEGGLGKTKHGTYNDEYALAAAVATQIVENGARFCPKQIQCTNKGGRQYSRMHFYDLNNYSDGNCLWLCKGNFSGANCSDENVFATDQNTATVKDKLFSGLSMKTSGGRLNDTGGNIQVFHKAKDSIKYEDLVALGVVKYLQHGVIASPIYLLCEEEGSGPKNVSYMQVASTYTADKQVLLCETGYKPNNAETDCVAHTQDLATAEQFLTENPDGDEKKFCEGVDKTQFNSSVHELYSDSCVRIKCRDTTKAFPSTGGYECVECSDSALRGGQHLTTGRCVQCNQPGQYFNGTACAPADAYNATQLKYGKTGKRKKNVQDECWTVVEPTAYKKCIQSDNWVRPPETD